MSSRTKTLTDADFDETTRAQGAPLLLVDFWADWCGPCKALAPVLDELAEEFGDELTVAKLDIVANKASADSVGVQSIPLLVFYCNGKEVARHAGVLSKTRLAALIDQHLA